MKSTIILMTLICSTFSFSQEIKATTDGGKRVLLGPNGSWRYADKTEAKLSEDSDCTFSKYEVDSLTGVKIKHTELQSLGKLNYSSLDVELRKIKNKVSIMATFSGYLGCATSESKITFKLKNREIIILSNTGEIDCAEGAAMYFNLNKSDIIRLRRSPLDKVKIAGSKFFVDIKLSNPNYFVDNLKCVE
jgi:hypothetical protein